MWEGSGMRTRIVLAIGLVVLGISGRATGADRTYAAKGPRAVETTTEPKSKTKVVRPTSGGPHPLVVASHGFAGSADNQMGWATHFAGWGFVVAVPSFASPLAPNHANNGKAIASLVAELTGPSAATFGVASGAFGLEGHSAGGLATTLAAADLTPGAVVLFDPVDAAGAGQAAYAKLCAPVLGIFAEPGPCNNDAGWRAFAGGTQGELLAFDVVKSTHCDGENAPRSLCGVFCSSEGASTSRQAAYAHYATAFLLAHLRGDSAAATRLAATATGADSEIADVLRASSTCASPAADAGTSGPSGDGGSGGTRGTGGSSGDERDEPSPAPSGDASSAEHRRTRERLSGGRRTRRAGRRSGRHPHGFRLRRPAPPVSAHPTAPSGAVATFASPCSPQIVTC